MIADTIKISKEVDKILSYEGGFLRGFMYEISGPDGCGKTTFATLCAAAAQRQGLKVGFIEIEKLNKEHAEFLGVDLEALDLRRPDCAEGAIEMILEMAGNNYGLIILDSVGSMVTREQLDEDEVGKAGKWAQIAGLLAKELPKVEDAVYLGNTALIFLNQIRAKFDKGFGFGPKTDSCGGFKIKHTVSARFEIRRTGWISAVVKPKEAAQPIGFRMRLRAPHKNRFACPNRSVYITVLFDHDLSAKKMLARKKKDSGIIQEIKVDKEE